MQYSAVQCSIVQYSTVQYSTVQYSAVTLRCAGAGVGGIIVKPGNATSTDYRVSQLSRGMKSECLLHL